MADKQAIKRRLAYLDESIDLAYKDQNSELIYKLESEKDILSIYLRALECSTGNPEYLERHDIQLEINPKLISSLDLDSKLSIKCLTAGECNV